MERQDLERMTREQLIAQAERLGIPRPRVLTHPEIVDEIVGRTTKGDRERTRARGWLGRARDLLAQVVEKGLHLPEAARALRAEEKSWPAPPPPLPTVTLAEIYAAQGHFERAITVLDEVLAREPEHREARALRERFVEQGQRSRSRSGREKEAPAPVKESAPAVKEALRGRPMKEQKAEAKPEQTAEAKPEEKAEAKPESVGVLRRAEEARLVDPEGITESAPGPVEAADTQRQGTVPPPRMVEAKAEPVPARVEAAPVRVEAASPMAAVARAEAEPASAEAEPSIPSTEPAPAMATVEALEEPPLPQRYEVDEVVAIAVDPRTIYLYWEVRATTLAHARARRPDGALCVRLASVTASWEGPLVDARDLHVDALYGDRFVRDVQPGSNVRVSVGWKSAEGFEPFAVGAEVMAPRMVPVESVSQDVARWEAEPVAPFAAWRADAPDVSVSPGRREGGGGQPPVRASLAVERVRISAGLTPAGRSGPVDTGVESWSGGEGVLELRVVEPGEEIAEGEQIVESAWYQAGGASELARGAPGRVLAWRRRVGPGAPPHPVGFGGASDLMLGGSSELGHG
jgi:hypothetical protein